ncbi:MAG: anthranilate phosphoribosyltransferase family protein [Cyanophyceae cyanobacterium]
MSADFRGLLKKVGSGAHTHQDLTRAEAEQAARLMLTAEATPAQIGAFLIAHRIKRPTPDELAGILDAYQSLGTFLPDLGLSHPLQIFGHPYDGRNRSNPVAPLVALILATVGIPVLQHGADVCPTKYGIPLVDLWQSLGLQWRGLSLAQVGDMLRHHHLGFLHTPTHFPLAQPVMVYRDQIGKRPPLATVELIWAPYAGDYHLISGFVHPPTEAMMLGVATLRGIPHLTTVKGLEGSCDLPRSRTAILNHQGERLLLKARDYNLEGSEAPFPGLEIWREQAQSALKGDAESPLWPDLLWNGGCYLWLCGAVASLDAGIQQAQELLQSGAVVKQLTQLQQVLPSP